MKKVVNEKLINRNKKIGNILTIAGAAILIGGLILNIRPDPTRTILSLAALIVGFVIAQISSYYVSRFVRSPRFDEIIADNLSKLNNDYTFYAYSGPVPMLLVGPHGIWIPIPLTASGEIHYDGKWKQSGGNFFLKFFGQETIGKPEKDIESRENQVRSFLKENFDETQMPSISSILVSLHPKATIGEVEDAPTPIVTIDALRRSIRKVDRKVEEIPQETLERINQLLKERE